jgi:hypothetical protein
LDALFVPVMRFEHMGNLLEGGNLGVIKVDVEGAEAEVLATLVDVVRRDAPWLLFEVLPAYRSDNAQRLDRQAVVENLVSNAGYVLFRILKTPENRLAAVTPIEQIGIHGDLTLCDYAAVPAQDKPFLIARTTRAW